jgi:DNA-binding transcriptional regulator YiaG
MLDISVPFPYVWHMAAKKPLRETTTAGGLAQFSTKELVQLEAELERLQADCRELAERLMTFGMRSPGGLDRRLTLVRGILVARALEPPKPQRGPTAEVAQIVRDTRTGMGLTQAEFAARVGVSANTAARWERGELGVRPSALRLIMMFAAGQRPESRKG